MAEIDTDRIKQSVDLRDLAGTYTELHNVKKDGVEMAGPCPKCRGDDRFHVKQDWWFCRQCYPLDNGKGHDAIAFVMWREDVDFREACRRLDAGAVASDRPRVAPQPKPKEYLWNDADWQAEAARFVREAQTRIELPDGEPGRSYLAGRGITPETWRAWGLGYATPKHPTIHEPRPAICLPWQGRGTIKAVQYRFFWTEIDHGDRFAQRAGGERTLYGVDLLGKHFDTLVLCEGELNALAIWQAARAAGLDRLDVLSFGSDSNKDTAGDLAPKMARRYKRVIVWADDPDKARAAMAAMPGARGLRSVEQDGRKLDANVLLQAGALGDFLAEALARLSTPASDATAAAWRDPAAMPAILPTLADESLPPLDRLKLGGDWLTDHAGEEGTPGYLQVLDVWEGLNERYMSESDALGGVRRADEKATAATRLPASD